MFYDLFLLLAGVYIGQEYNLPSVKNVTLLLYRHLNNTSFSFKNYINTFNE